jgi:hemin uptake protein HemP
MMTLRGRSEGRVDDKPSEVDEIRRSERLPLRITSAELLRGGREIVIQHGAAEYRLRVTGKLKLILTK